MPYSEDDLRETSDGMHPGISENLYCLFIDYTHITLRAGP